MIHVSRQAIQRAFQTFCSRRQEWVADLQQQLEMCMAAEKAFGEDGEVGDFRVVYEGLRKWQVSRKGQVKDAQTVFGMLGSLDHDLRRKCLSELVSKDWPIIWDAIRRLKNVKKNKTGSSIMAISKFLHFWNPRLFVICDQGEVEGFVFGHRWLKKELEGMDWVIEVGGANVNEKSVLLKYLKVLAFANKFVRANPGILPVFAQTVREKVGDAEIPEDIETHEATATEWCLVGLAEMPPAGVSV